MTRVELARSRRAAPRKASRLVIYAAVIVLVVVTGVYVVVVSPGSQAKPAIDFTVQISIQISNNNSSQIRFIGPGVVGLPGTPWASHVFDQYGLDGHYPLYVEAPTSNQDASFFFIHVRSTIAYNYTLGDFFAVWGYPIGPGKTWVLTSQPPDGPIWFMCVGQSQGTLGPGHWGAEVLRGYLPIILYYGKIGCGI